MQICTTCVLPVGYPGISFDENGVCSVCNRSDSTIPEQNREPSEPLHFENEEQVIEALDKYKKLNGKYDVLVSASGGVDSSFALIKLVETYKLKPLVWHNDHGYEDPIATDNVRKLCKALNVDLVILQQDLQLMKDLWKHVIENPMDAASTCFICANILYWNAIELAQRYDIKLIINGYSKGQVGLNKEIVRGLIKSLIQQLLTQGKDQLFEAFMKKYEKASQHKTYETRRDLLAGPDQDNVLVVPFFVFKFYRTDKQALQEECRRRFDWQAMEIPYPARTTNCTMNWLNTHIDLQRTNYSVYTEEYAGLVRAGEMTREQALRDLEFKPPQGLLERLATEIGVDLGEVR